MDALRIPALYFKQYCSHLAGIINDTFTGAGMNVALSSMDVVILIGVITGYFLHTFFGYREQHGTQHRSFQRRGGQPLTIDGKTKEEVRERAKRQL